MPHPVPPASVASLATPLPRYLTIAGPTASGKTAAALAIAQRYPVEIISVDSALVYRGMDIGSAKPSPAELAAVPHHLINIRDPLQPYSAAEFVRDAQALLPAITARGRLPLLVGGTLLYVKALRDGLDDMPPACPAIRQALEHEAAHKGWSALHAELALIDPVTAARLAPQDAQRIARALEVYRLTGLPLAHFHTIKSIASYAIPTGATSPKSLKNTLQNQEQMQHQAQNSLLIALEPQDRAWLHQRIAQRFDAMLAGGLLDEVVALRARGDLHPDLPAMRCVGYRQAWDYLDTLAAGDAPAQRPSGPTALQTLRDKGIAATRQLAKRQLTWLRAMPERQVVACDAPDALAQVLALAQSFITAND